MLALRRIDCSTSAAAKELARLRRSLSLDGEVVSDRGRALTLAAFGNPLTPRQAVERICRDVAADGLAAVKHYSRVLDQFELSPENLRVGAEELATAHATARPGLLALVRRVRQQLLAFQLGILHQDAVLRREDHELALRYRPLRRVGIHVPGGAAAYPSTLLMTAVPAQAAGVAELVVVAPPTPFGANNPDLLAVCHELGIQEVYRLGGAQAIASLAYGIDGLLPRVDMIVGPGNLFVALAKRHVYGHVGIDMVAGPSEVVVLADESARPDFLAADLIAQAEHAPGASLLVTWHAPLLDATAAELERQLADLGGRGDLARASLEQFGALLLVPHERAAVELVNELAPEHVHIQTKAPAALAERVDRSGAVFVGSHTPVAVGDYLAGPSHVLPTGGTARFASGLSANDFLRRHSVIRFEPAALQRLGPDVMALAELESLPGHAASVRCRLDAGRVPPGHGVASQTGQTIGEEI